MKDVIEHVPPPDGTAEALPSSPGLAKILVVDDTAANLVAMRRLLARLDVRIVEARSGNEALAACLDHEFALILLDVQMPDMDGFEVAALLSEESQTRDTPIIFVSAAFADDLNRLKGYHFGAVDYIAKPINDIILTSKVRVFLDLYRGRQQLRQLLKVLHERNAALENEIAERKRAEEQVRHQASHDALTGLPNRLLFMDRLEQALQRAQRALTSCALLYIDIDGFKPVNDRHGHHAGDLLLKAIAERLLETVRKSDTVARLGGDEFAVIMEGAVEGTEAALTFGEKLREALHQPYALDMAVGEPLIVLIGASIGISICAGPINAPDPREALIRAADGAMYQAKRGGKNAVILAGAP